MATAARKWLTARDGWREQPFTQTEIATQIKNFLLIVFLVSSVNLSAHSNATKADIGEPRAATSNVISSGNNIRSKRVILSDPWFPA